MIRCDIEPKFISYEFTDWAKKHNIRIETIQTANLLINGHAERYN
jgi:putative transposase